MKWLEHYDFSVFFFPYRMNPRVREGLPPFEYHRFEKNVRGQIDDALAGKKSTRLRLFLVLVNLTFGITLR